MYLTPLADLRFGHEIGINMRAPDTTEPAFTQFVTTVKERGLIAPMMAVKRVHTYEDSHGGTKDEHRLYVPVGGRRLAAMKRLQEEGFFPPDFQVEVDLRDLTDAEALELSIMENVERLPAHPVEVYTALVELENQGESRLEIAARFGLSEREVDQRMALGRIAPPLLEAWRAGKLNAESAQAFTVAPHDAQVAAYEAMTRAGHTISPGTVMMHLGARVEAHALKFVGEEAYRAAGGRMHADLFSENVYVLDGPILNALKTARVMAECERLQAEGWKWATPDRDLPGNYHSWKQEDPDTAAGYSAEARARLGVAVGMKWDGEGFALRQGLLRPEDAVAEAAAKPRPEHSAEEGPQGEPGHVVDRLRETMTEAWADVVAEYPGMAEELLLATYLAGGSPGSGSPVCVSLGGLWFKRGREQPAKRTSFPEALASVQEMNHKDRSALKARMVADLLDMTTRARGSSYDGYGVAEACVDAVGRLYSGTGILEQMRAKFDAPAYFDGAKKSHAMVCLTEALGEEEAKRRAPAKKEALAKLAAEVAVQKGWLPPALRVPGYACGPTPLGDARAAAKESVAAKRAERSGGVEVPPDVLAKLRREKAQRDHLLLLNTLSAYDEDSARPNVIESDRNAIAISAGTVGALIRLGAAAKTTRKGPTGQRAGYYLTPVGKAAAALLEPASV